MSGAGVLRLFRYSEGTLKQSSFAKMERVSVRSHAWLTADRLLAGTNSGRLLLFESGSLRREISVAAPTEGTEPWQPDRWVREGRASAGSLRIQICNLLQIYFKFVALSSD